jgi:hypothetical protein
MTLQLSAIGLVVSDMGRSLAFYRALGFDGPGPANASGQECFVMLRGPTRGQA